ncbi:MAG: Positive regulator of CheA protein [Myxococcaceae bacterium]|nr:Positive regulator of CheA protein [Myxococcaceae bacterium]
MRVGSLREQLVVLVFELDGHRYAIDTDSVLEIVRAVQPVRLAKAPAVIAGVINARGEVLALLDLRARFELPTTPVRVHDVFVIVQSQTRRLALRADRASELMRVPRASMSALGTTARADYLAGTVLLPDGLLLICDVELFLDEAERASLDRALVAHTESAAP